MSDPKSSKKNVFFGPSGVLEGFAGAAPAPALAALVNPQAHLGDSKEKKITNGDFKKIKSLFILKKIFRNLSKKNFFEIAKYNKNLKKRIDINIKDYKEYSELIEIEIEPVNNKYGQFINIKEEDKKYFHIYFNNNKKEIKRNYIKENEKIEIIKIIIDYQVNSFKNLFKNIEINKKIFLKMIKNNINDMNSMFYECSSLNELNLNSFNTINVTDMSSMFSRCSSLKELNLDNFDFSDAYVNDMFNECSENFTLKIRMRYRNIGWSIL